MGLCYDEEIILSSKYKRETALWRLTLLHEMVHLKLGVTAGHGPKFHTEMVRLSRAGAFKGLW
jgi:hypothetical protein